MNHHLIFDMHHLLHRMFFAITDAKDAETLCAMSIHRTFHQLNNMYKKYKPNNVVAAFDNSSWRKLYTASGNAITHKKYKGNRRKDLTEEQIIRFEIFDDHVAQFKTILKEKTGILILDGELLEADDLIAGFIQKYENDKHTLVSGDNDFLQLLRHPNLTIFDPIPDKNKTLEEYDFDPDYFIFHKCFRGDSGDNVMSSYPRLSTKKIKDAYTNEFNLENIMQHKFKVEYFDPAGNLVEKEYKTSEVYSENLLLMDLTQQPSHIKELIFSTIEKNEGQRSKYNMIEFIRYCNRARLFGIAEAVEQFCDVLVGHKNLIT